MNDDFLVEYNGNKINFGVGQSLVQNEKREREYFIESVLLSVYKIYGESDKNFEVELAIGLPIKQYKANGRIEYEKKLKDEFLDKKITAKVEKHDITMTIKFLKIYSEGFSGYVALYNEFQKNKPFLLIDVGYKTTDVMSININNDKLMIDNYESIDKGMFEIFEDVQKGFYNSTDENYPPETIENAIITNDTLTVYKPSRHEVHAMDYLQYGKEALKDIFNMIQIKFPDMRTRNLYLIGGGVEYIQKLLQFLYKDNKFKDLDTKILVNKEQSMYANVIGYYMQLEMDIMKIVESDDVFVSDKKLKGVALAEE